MNASDSHEIGIRPETLDLLHRTRSDADDRMFEQSAADHDDINPRIGHQFNSHRWAVCDHGRPEIWGKMMRHLHGGGPAVDEDDLSGLHQGRGCATDRGLLIRRHLLAAGEIGQRRRRWQGATMDTLQQAFAR
jgi:hypothetical protein